MSLWSRLFRRSALEVRGTTQDWVDMYIYAAENGLLTTSMGQLDEEQVAQTYAGIAKTNGVVFALVLARLQVFSQTRFLWTRFESGEPGDLFGSKDLRILERPWPGGTTADLLARQELDVSRAGNSFTRRLRRGRDDQRLVQLRPDWTIVVLGSEEDAEHPMEAADTTLVGYLWAPQGDRDQGGRAKFFTPDEVAHYAPYPDPEFHYVGMSWITPAIREVLGDNLMTDHKRAFLRNAATPNYAIKFDPSVTIAKVREFKALMEEEHQGVLNAWKTLFLGGGADPVSIGTNFQQLEFAVTQGKGESRLASDAGVPPSWVGFSEGLKGSALNAGNFNAARRRFGDGTMQHLWMNDAASLESIVDKPTHPNGVPDESAYLWFVTRGIPFLALDAADRANVQFREAQAMVALHREGWEADAAVKALMDNSWKHLLGQHSGLPSIQVQPSQRRPEQPGQPGAALPPGRGPNGQPQQQPPGQQPARALPEGTDT